MTKEKDYARMVVKKEFKKLLKVKAAQEGVTLLDLTDTIEDVVINPFGKGKKK